MKKTKAPQRKMNRILKIAVLVLLVSRAHGLERGDLPDVVVRVDTSDAVWVVTVKNFGPDPLKFEMLEKAPRGLGIEFWYPGGGAKVHAENLADLLGTHYFAPDYRSIEPGKGMVFNLNPKSVSAENKKDLERWIEGYRSGNCECRVFFKDYASPTISPFLEKLRGYKPQKTANKTPE